MTNKLVVIINSVKVPKIKKLLLYEMKFLVPNYSCLQNPWLVGYRPEIPVLSVLNWICWTPHPNKIPGYATVYCRLAIRHAEHMRLSILYPGDRCFHRTLPCKPLCSCKVCVTSASVWRPERRLAFRHEWRRVRESCLPYLTVLRYTKVLVTRVHCRLVRYVTETQFSQLPACEFSAFHCGMPELFRASALWRCAVGWVLPDVSMERVAVIF